MRVAEGVGGRIANVLAQELEQLESCFAWNS